MQDKSQRRPLAIRQAIEILAKERTGRTQKKSAFSMNADRRDLESSIIQRTIFIARDNKPMRNLRNPIAFALSLGFLTVGSAFGATASSNADAEIVPALAISNTAGLQFGQIAASGTAGVVTVTPGGIRSGTPGVTLGNQTTAGAASFAITGAVNNTYTFTLPSSILIDDGATHTMTVDNFVANPPTVGTISAGGTDTLTVGADLHVGINQALGDYTGTFDVSVDYN